MEHVHRTSQRTGTEKCERSRWQKKHQQPFLECNGRLEWQQIVALTNGSDRSGRRSRQSSK